MRYSLVIPTLDRQDILLETVRACLNLNYEDYEVLVSNNSSSDQTKEVQEHFRLNKKFRYIETSKRLSMPSHWEFAISHAHGENIIFLGDDDGVSPGIFLSLDQVMDKTSANMLRWNTGLYHHPDWQGEERNTIMFSQKDSGKIFLVDNRHVLSDMTSKFGFSQFPNLLRTCFSKSLYEKVLKKTGRVLLGAPDFSCPTLLLMEESCNYAIIDSTLGFGGRSRISNAAAFFSKEKFAKKRHEEFVSDFESEDPFPNHEPKVWTAVNANIAAFNFGRNFYPEITAGLKINQGMLCKAIAKEIREKNWYGTLVDSEQAKSFFRAVDLLEPEEMKQVGGLKQKFGVHSFRLLKGLLGRAKRQIFKFLGVASAGQQAASTKIVITGTEGEFLCGGDVIRKFDDLVELGQQRLLRAPKEYRLAIEIKNK
jgi:glycosyltransferase involved in cell wall biosynthesis